MDLLTRQQAQHHWFEADPRAKFDDLLEALGLYKDISTEYGLNQSVHQQWRFGDPHKKSGDPDRHDYEIKIVDGVEVTPGPVWHSLYRWIISQADEFLAFQTVYLITDNRDLLAATVSSTAGLSHWPMNVQSCLISAILAVLLIATAQEEFGIPECTTTIEAAGLDGPHRWGIILPNSSRVSLLSRSLYRSHVLNTFFGPVLRAMMKQVCWHSRRSEAHRGLPEARPRTQNVMVRGQSEAHGDSNLYNTRQD